MGSTKAPFPTFGPKQPGARLPARRIRRTVNVKGPAPMLCWRVEAWMLLPPPPEVPHGRPPRARLRRFAALSLCATMGGFFAARVAVAAHDPAGPYRKLDVFTHVLSLIENNYVEGVDETRLIYGAIEGMVRTLDPHSTFMDPKAYSALKQETDGEYGGVGLEVAPKNDELVVVAPIDDSPASRAGLLTGDRLLEIDGVT